MLPPRAACIFLLFIFSFMRIEAQFTSAEDADNDYQSDESKDQANARANDQQNTLANNQVNDLANVQWKSQSNYQTNARSNGSTNAQSNDEVNLQSNYQANTRSNDPANAQANDDANVQSNYEANARSNDPAIAQSNDQRNGPAHDLKMGYVVPKGAMYPSATFRPTAGGITQLFGDLRPTQRTRCTTLVPVPDPKINNPIRFKPTATSPIATTTEPPVSTTNTTVKDAARMKTELTIDDIIDIVANLTSEYDNNQLLLNLNESLYGKTVSLCSRLEKMSSAAGNVMKNVWMIDFCILFVLFCYVLH